MFYGEPTQTSPIPVLKSGLTKYKRTNKMGPKARRCFYLSPARNYPSESKRVLVQPRNVIATENITWAHVTLARRVTVQSKPSVEGERNDWLREIKSGKWRRAAVEIPAVEKKYRPSPYQGG